MFEASLKASDIDVESAAQSSCFIPTEVCENVIDMLYSGYVFETRKDMVTLHSCSLVCRAWRVRSQRMLFYKVQISDGATLHRFSTVLDFGQHLRAYVREVVLTGYYLQTTITILTLFPALCAGRLPNLWRLAIAHLPETMAWFPRPSDPGPKSKPLSYIPLHPRFPVFLSSFTAVSSLVIHDATFRSFSEFTRMLHALPNLEVLLCDSIRWLTTGGSNPGSDITMARPTHTPGKRILPSFAPKLRMLHVSIPDEIISPGYDSHRFLASKHAHVRGGTTDMDTGTLSDSLGDHNSSGEHSRTVRSRCVFR